MLNRIDPGETPMQTLHQRFLWLVRAELALAEGEPAAALEIADRLIPRTANLSAGDGRVVPHLWLLRGQALTATGRPAEAESLLEAAVEVAIDQGRRRLLWRLACRAGRGQDCPRQACRSSSCDRGRPYADRDNRKYTGRIVPCRERRTRCELPAAGPVHVAEASRAFAPRSA